MARGDDERHNDARIVDINAFKRRNHPAVMPIPESGPDDAPPHGIERPKRKSVAERIGAKIISLDSKLSQKIDPNFDESYDPGSQPEYTGQEASLTDIAPRNLIDKAKGGTGRVPKKPLITTGEDGYPTIRRGKGKKKK
jgi:hypothetical protein